MTNGAIILSSLAKAACYQQRVDWMEVLINRSITLLNHLDAQTILSSLPSNDQGIKERFFTQLLIAENSIEVLPRNLEIILQEQYWSPTISSLVLQKFHQYAQQQNYYYYAQQLSNSISSHLHISILPELLQLQATCVPEKFNYNSCLELLEFRRNMREIFDTT